MKFANLCVILSVFIIFILSPTAQGTVIDFEGHSSGTYIDTEYTGLGVTFDPGGFITFGGPGKILNVGPEIVARFGVGVSVNEVAVDYISSVPLTMEAFDSDDNNIDMVTTSAGQGSFGLSSNEMIKKVVIHDNGWDFAIDNFSFSVPEASSLTLFVSCLIGLFYMKRKAF